MVCGCGGGEAVPWIEFYGDSLTFGAIEGPPGAITRLAVPPVRRAQELLGTSALCVDLSLPGATVADALADGDRAMLARLPAPVTALPWRPLSRRASTAS